MALSHVDLIKIVEQSSTLDERLSGRFTFATDQNPKAEARLKRWEEVAPEDLCEWRACSPVSISSVLGNVELPIHATLPSWAGVLQNLSAMSENSRTNQVHGTVRRVPFSHLFVPMACWAGELARKTAANDRVICRRAWRDLEDELTSRLSGVCAAALQSDFLAYCAMRRSPLSARLFRAEGAHPVRSAMYASFIEDCSSTGLATFFKKHPTAGRLCARITEDWISFVSEFQRRLEGDRLEVASLCKGKTSEFQVLRVKAGIADRHRGGRTALILTLSSGRKVVYKPRSVAVEASFSQLLTWLGKQTGSLSQMPLRLLSKPDYGWMEFAEYQSCRTRTELRQFYERAGGLLALVHLFRGIDFHRENLIAVGAFPVLVDLEALCHPDIPGHHLTGVIANNCFSVGETVLRTTLLPLYQLSPCGKRLLDVSGLGSAVNMRAAIPGMHWEQINTDAMQLVAKRRNRVCMHHRPSIRGLRPNPKSHVEFIVKGFKDVACALASHANNRQFRKLAERVCAAPTRLVVRPTISYNTVLRSVQSPACLRDGIDRSIELRVLPRRCGSGGTRSTWSDEIEALENLDIPYFPASQSMKRNSLQILSPEEVTFQANVIRASFHQRLVSCAGLASPNKSAISTSKDQCSRRSNR